MSFIEESRVVPPMKLSGVVDPQLRVYGVQNLRVVDGPRLPQAGQTLSLKHPEVS